MEPIKWSSEQQRLARAVLAATKRECPYAPMENHLAVGSYLMRSVDRIHYEPTSGRIDRRTAIEAIKVRDAAQNKNRFTGMIPGVAVARGGLYCSQSEQALMAELYHYASPALPRGILGKVSATHVFLPKCFALLQVTRNVDVVNLGSKSSATLRFLERLQRDNEVHSTLKALGYRDLFSAVFHGTDYATSRGLGVGLASNPGIEGLEVMSARDYLTNVGDREVLQSGNNVVLFKENNQLVNDVVRVTSLHLVDRVSGEFTVTHFMPTASGSFVEAGSQPLPR